MLRARRRQFRLSFSMNESRHKQGGLCAGEVARLGVSRNAARATNYAAASVASHYEGVWLSRHLERRLRQRPRPTVGVVQLPQDRIVTP